MNKHVKIAFAVLSAVTALLAGCLARSEPMAMPAATSVTASPPVPVPTMTSQEASGDVTLKLAPASALPPELRQLPSQVQEAYRFALANPDVLEAIPCYCGCGGMGHENNRMCYVQPETADGQVVFDSHAAT